METTGNKFTKKFSKEKEVFNRGYDDFLLSELVLAKMKKENISIRTLAKKAGVSPTVIQKMRSIGAEKVSYKTFSNVLNSLGYKIIIEKI
jgi:hypothetical protein